MNGSMSASSEAEEISNSRNVLFSPQQSSTTAVEMDETELPIGPLSADEEAFFEAVRSGDKDAVQNLIRTKRVDVNCRNTNGETTLQIAIEDEAIDIVQMLLRNKAEIGSALFQAVRNNSLQCVRTLVAYDSNRKSSTANTLDRSPVTTKRSSSGKFDEFLTPLGLAVLNGNYGIVEFLVSKGYRVEDPQTQKAQDAAERNEKESMVRLKDSLVKLNTYRALASPLYISHLFLHESKHWGLRKAEHSASDPLFRSIVLKKKLRELAVSEAEFRDEYRALSVQCENFAIQLLDECRNIEEIAAVMDMPELEKIKEDSHLKVKEQRLRVLNLAIKNQNIKFIAHPYSQVMLNSVVYKGTSGWHQLSFPAKVVLAMLYTLVMPLCMLGYMLTPTNRITKKLDIPLFKLMSQASSVLWFLVLVTMSAFQDKYDSFLRLSPLTVLIGIWVIGITVQEVKQALHQGKERYFSEWWHLAVIPMIMSYIIAAVLWIVGYAFIASDSGEWTVHVRQLVGSTSLAPYHLLLLSNSFYSFALVLTFFEASHVLQVNSTLGPLHLSLMNMGKDIMKFFVLFGLNVCAFALAMRKLYSQYVQTSTQVTENNSTTNHAFERIEGTFATLFWALFGHVEMSNFDTPENAQITEVTGHLLFALYSLASVLVALNLLIAMLSNTYKKVSEEKDIKFKFARTRVWMYYVSEISVLPPPFNLFPVEKAVMGVHWLARRYNWIRKCLGRFESEPISTRIKTNEKRRRAVIKNLIHRYFSANEKPQNEDPGEEFPPSEDIQYKLMEVTQTLQSLQNVVKRFRQMPKEKRSNQETEIKDGAVLSRKQEPKTSL
ncbi:short transient receptor potential channel 3-like [Oculina patagonica]